MKKPALRQVSHWGRLSDDELLSTVFTTTAPEALDGLVARPIVHEDARVELAYDFRGMKRAELVCAHCGTHPNHKAGYVIRVGDARFLCGHQCGDKLYGADFEWMYSEYESAKSKAITLKRMRNLRDKLPEVNAFCAELIRNETGRRYSEMRKSIFPRIKGEVEIAFLHHNGQLMAHVDERDFDGEKRLQSQYDKDVNYWKSLSSRERSKLEYAPQPPRIPRMIRVLKPFGVVYTPTLFGLKGYKHDNFISLTRQFESLASFGVVADVVKNSRRPGSQPDFDYALKQTNVILDVLIAEIEKLNEWDEFFTLRNLQLIAEWATNRDDIDGDFSAGPDSLIQTIEEQVRVFRKLPGYKLVDLKILRDFKVAINAIV